MNHITLTGNLGSGKSTICKILESQYGYEIYSTGKVQRSLATQLGISVLEMNQKMCEDSKYDKMIDDATAKISKENPEKKIVFDSRLAWNFVEHSFKVFLSVSLEVAAQRVFHDNRGAVEKYSCIEETIEQLKLRAQTEDIRYKEIYGIDYFNFKNYDLILDSTWCKPEWLAQILESEACKPKSDQTKLFISPKRILEKRDFPLENNPKVYIPDEVVELKAEKGEFTLLKGNSFVERAAKEGYSLTSANLV